MAFGYRPGSDEDFDRLYRDSHGRLLATLIPVLRDRAEAEDCVQEAFLRAYKAWPRWKPDAPPEAWLHRIAMRVALNEVRRRRLREIGETLRRLGRPPSPPDPAQLAERSDAVDALRRLPPQMAAAVVLRHFHGYSNREIAYSLRIPESTVSSRLRLAIGRLRREVDDADRERERMEMAT